MAIKISIANQKGGVGKTTTSVNISAGLASVNKNVLLIDMDPQGNASTGMGIDMEERHITIYEALIGHTTLKSAIINTYIPNLDIITSNVDLVACEIELNYLHNKETILRTQLQVLDSLYDFIIIDCPPSLGILTINALCAADELIIPMQCEFYSLEGVSHLLRTVNMIQSHLNKNLTIKGLLLTMHDKRNSLTEQVEDDVRQYLKELVFQTVIPRNVKLSEAPSHGKPGIVYDYRSTGAIAYINFVKELLSRYE